MPKRTARRHVRRPTGVERLEPRQLLTSAPWIVAGDADPSAPDDLIVVALDPTNAAVLQVTVNGSVVGSRPVSWRGEIQIHGGRGDDVIRVETPSLTRGFVFYGGPGNDVLVGGPVRTRSTAASATTCSTAAAAPTVSAAAPVMTR